VILQAVGIFAVTNVDDLLLLSLYSARAGDDAGAVVQVVLGQYIGFAFIVIVSVAAALGATLLPESAIAYLGLLPIALGLRAVIRARRGRSELVDVEHDLTGDSPRWASVATVTFANGGDNIGVYVPVFAAAGRESSVAYVVVFLVMVGLWCTAGRYFATRPIVAPVFARWGHLLLPAVLITIGIVILLEGGAFGL
jgi:cadmium resistance protein CadD (predicted permease)